MKAYFYSIRHKHTGNVVDKGIIRNSEDTIYPQQNTGIEELPYECEAHHFKSTDYELYGWYFDISFAELVLHRI